MERLKASKIASLPLKRLDLDVLIPYLGKAREALGRLDEQTAKVDPSVFEITKWQESIFSLRSQNFSAKLEDVLALDLGIERGEKQSALLQKILFVKKGLDLAIRSKHPFQRSTWCAIHKIVKQDGPNPKEIGRIRTRQNWIGEDNAPMEEAYFYPPPPSHVAKHLQQLERYLQKDDLDPLLQIAVSFAQFLIIHPFMDGNGRVARIFIPIFLVKKKLLRHPILGLSAYFELHRHNYFQKLYDITAKNDWEAWIIYFLEGVISSAKQLLVLGENLKRLYAKIPEKTLFIEPVLQKKDAKDTWIKMRVLTARQKEFYIFRPLFDLIR